MRSRGWLLVVASVVVSLLACAQARADLVAAVTNQGDSNLTNDGTANVRLFNIGAGGLLTPFAGSPVTLTTGGYPYGAAFTPDDRFLYLDDQVSAIDPFTVGSGAITPASPVSTGSGTSPQLSVVSPDGTRLYVADVATDQVSGFSIGPSAGLTPLPDSPYTIPNTVAQPGSMAMTPDGAHLYVSGFAGSNNELAAFTVGSDGSLSQIAGSPYSIPQYTNGIRITPNGPYMYLTNQDSSAPISIFAIGAGGILSPITAPVPSELSAANPAVSPDGKRLYVGQADGTVLGYAIGPTGELSALPNSPFTGFPPGEGTLWDLEFTPDGHTLYGVYSPEMTTQNGSIATFTTGSDGSLTISQIVTDTGGTEPFQDSLAISPDPGPVARLTPVPTPSGPSDTVAFSASGSSATVSQCGSLTYDWNFGDGTSQQGTSPFISHSYSRSGTFNASVTVADSAGCSFGLVWDGTTSYCASDPAAVATETVYPGTPTAQPTPKITGVGESHKTWRDGSKLASIAKAHKAKKPPVGTTFSLTLNEAAQLKLGFSRQLGGRKVKGKCVAQTRNNRHDRRCTLSKSAGSLSLAGHDGASKISFQGRLSHSKKLAKGKYTVSITATNTLKETSSPARLAFTIVK